MTYLEIEAFLAITRCGTITKAAEELHISQPALSKRIAFLEKELGYKLITRKKGIRLISLTDMGKAFIPIANRWTEVWKDAKTLKYYSPKVTFRLAASDGPYLHVLPNVFKKFVKRYPNVNLHLDTLKYSDSYQNVANGSVDMAFTSVNYYYKNIQAIPVYSEKMYFMCRIDADYPKVVSSEHLSVGDTIFSGYSSDYVSWFNHWFGSQQKPFIVSDLIAQTEDFMTSFDKNTWTIVPASVAKQFEKNPKLTYRQLENTPPDRIVYCILKIGNASEHIDPFIELLKETVSEMSEITSLL